MTLEQAMITREELIERMARVIDPVAWSYKEKPKDTFTRESARLRSISKATAAIATILEALSEPTDLMGLGLPADYRPGNYSASQIWQAMLAASPLSPKEGVG